MFSFALVCTIYANLFPLEKYFRSGAIEEDASFRKITSLVTVDLKGSKCCLHLLCDKNVRFTNNFSTEFFFSVTGN